jgi:hypothetical protein
VPAVDRWLVFLLVVFSADACLAAFFRVMSYSFPTQEVSQAAGTGLLSIWILFAGGCRQRRSRCSHNDRSDRLDDPICRARPPASAGFFVISSQMPVWLGWIRFIRCAQVTRREHRDTAATATSISDRSLPLPSACSPFYWGVTTLTNNEFDAPQYATAAPTGTGSAGESLGKLYISQFNYPFSVMAKWGGERRRRQDVARSEQPLWGLQHYSFVSRSIRRLH